MKGLKQMIDIQVPLTQIEEAFADVLERRKELRSIAKTIKVNAEIICKACRTERSDGNDASANVNFDVKFVDGKDQFLGVSVYPSIEAAARLSKDIVYVKGCTAFIEGWLHMKDFVIEIDENLFDRSIIAFNPQELTAMMLHEISHVLFCSKKAERLYTCYRSNITFLNNTRNLREVSILTSIFYPVPVAVVCGMHEWTISKDGMMEEWICDEVFGVHGYQEHMVSALNKIIRAYGNTIVNAADVQEHNLEVDVKWCNLNVKELVRRRELLRPEIFSRASRTRSYTVRHAYLNIVAKLGIGLKDRYTSGIVAMEAVLADIDEGVRSFTNILSDYKFYNAEIKKTAAIESLCERAFTEVAPALEGVSRRKHPKLPSDYAIDEISIEIDKIENHYDRIYVLDLIYNRLEEIDRFESYYTEIGEIHKYAAKIKSKREYLEKLREGVLEKKVLDKNYSVFIKCPKGYEG